MNMIGHNNPPLSPYELSKKAIEDLYEEARQWLDGDPVTTAEQAAALNTLQTEILKASKEADERRKEEARPFDEGKADVQARYNPLIQKDKGLCDKAIASIKAALKPYLIELDRQQREAEAKAREEADRLRQEALAAMRAREAENLASVEAAEAKVAEAEAAAAAANKAAKAKAHAKGEGRATGLRTVWKATMVDPKAAAAWAWAERRAELLEFVQSLADADVRRGGRSIPGFEIIDEKVL
jgi:hypothetical protein